MIGQLCKLCKQEFQSYKSDYRQYCSYKCKSKNQEGSKCSEETRKKMSEAHKREKAYNWKGGVRNNNDYLRKYQKEYLHRIGKSKKYAFELGISKTLEYKRKYRKRYTALQRKGGELPIERIQLVYEDNIKKYGTLTCYLCEKAILFGNDDLEHKIPLSRNGTHKYNNLAIACRSCNSKKYNKTEEEYRCLR